MVAAFAAGRRNPLEAVAMRTIDARPSPYRFESHHAALLMIGMQRDFLEPGGFGAMLGNGCPGPRIH